MWDLVGVREAADILGWPTGMVSSYLRRGLLPEPVARLACGSIWLCEDIEAYARRRNPVGRTQQQVSGLGRREAAQEARRRRGVHPSPEGR